MRLAIAILLTTSRFILAQDMPRLPRVVTNPAASFYSEWKPIDRILEIHADFDADGIEDVAYADHGLCGHRGNCSWDIFLRRADRKYIEVGVIEYRLHLRISRSKYGGAIIKTYIPGGGGQGAIISYRISKRGLKELGNEGIDLEKNGYRIDQVFGKRPHELKASKDYSVDELRVKAGAKPL